jgi:hypothetical protein
MQVGGGFRVNAVSDRIPAEVRMGIGVRLFLFLEDGSIRRISWKGLERLRQEDTPEFAGRTIRCADVALEIRNRRPHRIVRIAGGFLRFDERGSARESVQASIAAAINRLDEPRRHRLGNIVDISEPLARARADRKFLWQPTPADITRLTQLIWKPRRKPTPPARPSLRRVK